MSGVRYVGGAVGVHYVTSDRIAVTAPSGKKQARLVGLSGTLFRIVRGCIEEYKSTYDGNRYVVREITETAAEIIATHDEAIETLQAALARAQRARVEAIDALLPSLPRAREPK